MRIALLAISPSATQHPAWQQGKKMSRARVILWSIAIVCGVALIAGCGDGRDDDTPPGTKFDPGNRIYNPPRGGAPATSISCSPVGATRECIVDVWVNDVHSCFDGLAVCQGETGWTDCLDPTEARKLAEEVEQNGGVTVSSGGAGGSSG